MYGYVARNDDGSIKYDHGDPPKPVTNLTYDHEPPMANRYNDRGHKQSKAERSADFNDPDQLTPMGRKENSSKGSGGEQYTAAPEGDPFKEE